MQNDSTFFFFLLKREMALMVERLLAARFCGAIAHLIHTECFLSLNIKPDVHMAAGQFEASKVQPTDESVFLVSAKGHVQIMRCLSFRHSLDWNHVLKGASYGGQLPFVYLSIYKGASNWNDGLHEACRGEHRDIAEFMVSKGVDGWNWGLQGACKGGHRELVEWMISKGANHWNAGLCYACKLGHMHIARLMIQKGATICIACWKAMSEHV
jgi:hypothetical protein